MIAAKVQDPTGRWLSLDARFLKCQQRTIGWIYDAALRTELTSRLGVAWGPVAGGQADLTLRSPRACGTLFSQRTAQVEAKLAELIGRWSDEHDGAEPDAPHDRPPRTRAAVLASRPAKVHGSAPPTLRADWAGPGPSAGLRPRRPDADGSPTPACRRSAPTGPRT